MRYILRVVFGVLLIGLASAEAKEIEIHAMSFNIRLGVAKDGPKTENLKTDQLSVMQYFSLISRNSKKINIDNT